MPWRTAAGVALFLFALGLTLAGSDDVQARYVHVPITAITDFYRGFCIVAPIAGFLIAYLLARELRASRGVQKAPRVRLRRNARAGAKEGTATVKLPGRPWYLAAAFVVAIGAVASPLDRLADDSFAWHMFQHMLVLFLVPALLLLAQPSTFFSALAGKRATERTVRVTRTLHVLAAPPVALAVFIGTLWLTHFTGLYELSLQNPVVHAAEHALYFVAGIFFWLPVLAPAPLRPPSYPLRLLYLLIALPQGALLGWRSAAPASRSTRTMSQRRVRSGLRSPTSAPRPRLCGCSAARSSSRPFSPPSECGPTAKPDMVSW